MNRLWCALPFAAALALAPAARAQTSLPSPQQLQAMIAAGQDAQAVTDLTGILQDHPKSAVGWYLLAEAYDGQNKEAAAADALNMAERIAPGLPFASPPAVAALRAHITASQPPKGGHVALYVIVGLVLLLLLLRFLPGRGMAPRYGGYAPPPGSPPYGYGPPGGGIGSALAGGLAAGAGFAVGERLIDGLTGEGAGGAAPVPGPSRDDGLLGNPGWDDSSTPGGDLGDTGWS